MSERKRDLTELSYWFPIIEAAGLPVPKTILVDIDEPAFEAMIGAFDGTDVGDTKPFFNRIAAAAGEIGYPCFLRTDHTSAKHDWKDSCYLTDPGQIGQHVFQIVEYSEMASLIGLPWNRWAVREFLPTIPLGVCPSYGDMPICREFRFFVRDGKVVCHHPYWPQFSLEQGGAVFNEKFDKSVFYTLAGIELAILTAYAEKAGAALGGSWSIDFLETEKGWYLTDMAVASRSYHWPECQNTFA